MNSDKTIAAKNPDLISFACRFLKNKGAVLESANALVTDALIPEELADALDVEEYISFSKDMENVKSFGGKNLYSIQFQSPFLDKIVSMAGSTTPFLQCELKFNYIKTQGFANLIREQFEFHKSKIKITGTGKVITRYALVTCMILAQSDEQKQGLFDFSFNIDTGAVIPDMSEMMTGIEKEFDTINVHRYSENQIRHIHELVSIYGPEAVEGEFDNFIHSMNRRFKRDSLSLDRYYEALKKEMEESLLRTGLSDKLIQERQSKIDMIPHELAAKKKDLLNKYSIKIGFTPIAALSITCPCVKVFASLISGHDKHEISMIYNPVTKRFDPMVCKSCGMSTYSIGVCRNMHLNCTACLNRGCRFCCG